MSNMSDEKEEQYREEVERLRANHEEFARKMGDEIHVRNNHVRELKTSNDRLRAENEKLRQGISEYNFELEALKKENERFKDNSLAGCIPLLQSYEDSLQACHDEIHRLKDLIKRARELLSKNVAMVGANEFIKDSEVIGE